MFYPQDVVAEVRSLNDIVEVISSYVKLSPRSGNHFGLCPFHGEKTPSFSANRDKQIFYCFGCGAGGNVISFVMRMEKLDFVDALKLLADRVRLVLPEKSESQEAKKRASIRESANKLNKRAARFYYDYLQSDSKDAQQAREYLSDRGVRAEIIKRFGIGLSPPFWDGIINHFGDVEKVDLFNAGLIIRGENEKYYDRFRKRIMFPIIDNRNRVVGFGGRILEPAGPKDAKYMNTPETVLFHKSDHLYGLNVTKKRHQGELYIVEGYMDVIAMHIHGFINTVGVLGTSLTESHGRVLRGAGVSTVTLLLDGDQAGKAATERAIPILRSADLSVKVLELPDAKDPDEFLSRFGASRFISIPAKTGVSFKISLAQSRYNMENTDGRIGFTREAAKILSDLASDIEMDFYAKEIAILTGIDTSAILSEARKHQNTRDDVIVPQSLSVTRMRIRGEDTGLTNAKRNLLGLLIAFPHAAKVLEASEILTPEDMVDEMYGKLLGIAFKNASENSNLAPADIINFFDSTHEQQIAAEVLIGGDESLTASNIVEKALNDIVRRIKLAQLEQKRKASKSDMNALRDVNNEILHVTKNQYLLNYNSVRNKEFS